MAEVIRTVKAVERVAQIGSFIEKDFPFPARRVVQPIIKETAHRQAAIDGATRHVHRALAWP
jgi:hypothetical protein